ncbi:cytochrome P450 [Desarmillaria tabescens]|uniref:Cytochrome P450 n=1 Tax=Armillaria tabescens TaxID=1929756 RepID=A0AA39NHY4_ARMTA|nr:cytochrome P450 [Desarmillaria tabescens]KAK0465859.1 cytochrome P450 [Desarmillaria tabescens]
MIRHLNLRILTPFHPSSRNASGHLGAHCVSSDSVQSSVHKLSYQLTVDGSVRIGSQVVQKDATSPKYHVFFDMSSSLTALAIAISLFGLVVAYRLFYPTRRSTPFPPGPKGFPLIGNILDMPSDKEWLTFARWGEKHGNVASVSVLGRRIVVINSVQMAIDMLDKKGAIYSDRPIVAMGGELVGWKNGFSLMPYGPRFCDSRRRVRQVLGTNASFKQFLPVVELEAHQFLKRISADPEELFRHIRKMNVANIMQISYGYEIQEENDPFVKLADQATHHFALSTTPGAFLVNVIPILRHIPDWFPGAEFKRTAKEWRSTLCKVVERPHDFVKQRIAAGDARYSFTSSQLEDGMSIDKEFDIKWAAATLYIGGSDTTVAAISAFFKAMIMYPDIQAKAQAEIDTIVGNDRLPRFDDRGRLPYINALALEVSRWHVVGPLALPHSVSEDDVQLGYFIPKGSVVLANVWNMLHDPTVYEKPFEFRPERFMRTKGKEPEMDPHKVAFGFGRRICPGRLLADSSLFISCAMVLAVFNISKYSENGVVLEPDMEHTAGTVSHPSSFKCTIKPRSEKVLELINAGFE